MRSIFLLSGFLMIITACTKNKFTTKPQLKIKDVNSTVISGNQDLVFTIRLTDKEGDFTHYFGISTKVPNCPASQFIDSNLFQIPQDFIDSKNKDGEIVLTLSKSQRHSNLCSAGGAGQFKTDTTTFSFWTKDKAGNVSDTVKSSPIIIQY